MSVFDIDKAREEFDLEFSKIEVKRQKQGELEEPIRRDVLALLKQLGNSINISISMSGAYSVVLNENGDIHFVYTDGGRTLTCFTFHFAGDLVRISPNISNISSIINEQVSFKEIVLLADIGKIKKQIFGFLMTAYRPERMVLTSIGN